MPLNEILEFVLLPCVAWLLITTYTNSGRLARIETTLDILVTHKKNQNQ